MKPKEARMALRRLLVHLKRDQYEACHDVLRELEDNYRHGKVLSQERRDELECIASLPIELRWVNMLEKAGYIYISDLDGVDIRKMSIRQLGPEGKNTIYRAVNKVREQLAQS